MSKARHRDRFLTLLQGNERILFKVAGSYCRNAADREDLVQEMVLQLWRSFDRYDASRRFSTWMYRVALNVAISFARSETRRPRLLAGSEQAILEIAAAPSDSGASDDELGLLRGFIERLDELDRALVILYLDGNRYDTIAEILGISETNVGTKISRIKQRLQHDVAEHVKQEQTLWTSTT
jgi:RNA polymerase sigma factor (sigma-70 family)